VCGTSIGALVGAAYAVGELDRLERWVRGLSWTDVLKLVDPSWRGGLIKGQKLFDFLRAHFEDRELGTLGVAYGAVATDLGSGREIWLRDGKVLEAVRASIAMPGVFPPVRRDGLLLVDGGVVNPVPVSMCRALGAEVVVAVDLGWAKLGRQRPKAPGQRAGAVQAMLPPWLERFEWLSNLADEVSAEQERESAPSILEVFMTSIDIMQVRVARSRLAGDPAEAMVTPMLPDFVTMDFHRAAEAIEEGREAVARARAMLERMTEM
jgi:NTE family protein